jgi:FkbM family methyltransferase
MENLAISPTSLKKKIFLLISKNRNNWFLRGLNKCVSFLYFAFQNKNNDHATNGEFWLMNQVRQTGANVIFDVGANVGKWSIEALKTFGDSTVYAFEPMPEVFSTFQKNAADKPGIKMFNLALSNETGSVTFNYYPKAILFSSMYNHFKGGESKQIKVDCIDGDSFCGKHGINEIDFLKLDVEGSEHLILAGFHEMLRQQRIKVIQFEYGIFSIESKFLLKDYFNLFERYGYKVGKIYPNYIDFSPYNWSLENFIGPNYAAIRSKESPLIESLSYTRH